MGFVEKTTDALARGAERILLAEEISRLDRMPQRLDARVKLVTVVALLLVVSLARDHWILLAILGGSGIAASAAGHSALLAWLRHGAAVLPLSVMMALPAVLTTPGRALDGLALGGVELTRQGAQSALMLVLRVQAAAGLGALLILTTRWQHLVRALRAFRMPETITAVLTMTVRYVVLLLATAADLFQARRSRLVARPDFATRRQLATSAAGALLSRSIHVAEEVHLAMVARGGGPVPAGAGTDSVSSCPMPLYSAIDLGYSYGAHRALDGATFQIEPGERVAVVGANGSGKSTLLRLLDGLYVPGVGRLSFRGIALDEERLADERFGYEFRRSVGYLFQSSDVQLFNATVFDEVAFGPARLGLRDGELREAVYDTLARLSIAQLADRPPHRLSGGEKKRVALASVLVLKPDVLLLDEPTAGLDPRSRRQLIELLGDLGAPGTLIVATHDLELAQSLTERALLLQEGRIEGDAATDALVGDCGLLQSAGVA